VHHTNEIAQSEAATGKPFFNVWMHGAFLIISGGKKMAKSEGNFLTIENAFVKKGMDPLAYRYATFQTHYRKPMEYSEEGMDAALNGLQHLRNQVRTLMEQAGEPHETGVIDDGYRAKFLAEINDDLNMPRAMAVVQELLKSSLSAADKLATLYDFDHVLGFDLAQMDMEEALPEDIQTLADQRLQARADKNWALSDELRDAIQARGYLVQDSPQGTKVFKP
jgi:cysteinyl-tRNA synthetase